MSEDEIIVNKAALKMAKQAYKDAYTVWFNQFTQGKTATDRCMEYAIRAYLTATGNNANGK